MHRRLQLKHYIVFVWLLLRSHLLCVLACVYIIRCYAVCVCMYIVTRRSVGGTTADWRGYFG